MDDNSGENRYRECQKVTLDNSVENAIIIIIVIDIALLMLLGGGFRGYIGN